MKKNGQVLIESLIALTIFVLAFSIAFATFVQASKSSINYFYQFKEERKKLNKNLKPLFSSMLPFEKRSIISQNGSIFLLNCLGIITLLLFLAFFAKTSLLTSRTIANKSQLDICAVARTTRIKNTLQQITTHNLIIDQTKNAIYVARGMRLASPVTGVFSGMAEAVLLKINHGSAVFQTTLLQALQTAITASSICKNTPFSKELASCLVTPPPLGSLHRLPSRFPDVKNILVANSTQPLFKILCLNSRGTSTKTSILGPVNLMAQNYQDFYEI